MIQLIKGDCLDEMQNIADKSIDCIICDLPYGTTACKWDTIIPFEPLWEQYKRIIKDNGAIVLTASQPFTSALVMSNVKMFKYCWVWNKEKAANFPNVKNQPLKIHEDVVVFGGNYKPIMTEGIMRKKGGYSVKREVAVMAGAPAKVNNLYYPKSILNFSVAGNHDSKLHPTQKPVALFEYLIKTYTNENEVILDNCTGSGTTAIAAINTNRKYIGFEMDKTYFDIACKRVENALS